MQRHFCSDKNAWTAALRIIGTFHCGQYIVSSMGGLSVDLCQKGVQLLLVVITVGSFVALLEDEAAINKYWQKVNAFRGLLALYSPPGTAVAIERIGCNGNSEEFDLFCQSDASIIGLFWGL